MTQAAKCARFQLKNTASLSSAGESTPVHGGHFRTGGLSHWPGAGSDLQKVRLSQPPPCQTGRRLLPKRRRRRWDGPWVRRARLRLGRAARRRRWRGPCPQRRQFHTPDLEIIWRRPAPGPAERLGWILVRPRVVEVPDPGASGVAGVGEFVARVRQRAARIVLRADPSSASCRDIKRPQGCDHMHAACGLTMSPLMR